MCISEGVFESVDRYSINCHKISENKIANVKVVFTESRNIEILRPIVSFSCWIIT